jgi:hypothetical protein
MGEHAHGCCGELVKLHLVSGINHCSMFPRNTDDAEYCRIRRASIHEFLVVPDIRWPMELHRGVF